MWAALFDWDGVIVDSSRQHEQSWEALAEREGLPLPDGHFKRGFGKRNEEVIADLLGWTRDPLEIARLADSKEDHFRELIRRDGLDPLPGVREWLDELRRAAVPCAVGSSTTRLNIELAIDILGLRGRFQAIVAAEDVTRGKPHPEVFERAAHALGYGPSRSVVFEDAPMGIEAARVGGMRIVAVAGTHPADAFAGVDRVVHRLDELRVADISRWF
jgi:HAD superfamily hydrolase (TIGR01509 family)